MLLQDALVHAAQEVLLVGPHIILLLEGAQLVVAAKLSHETVIDKFGGNVIAQMQTMGTVHFHLHHTASHVIDAHHQQQQGVIQFVGLVEAEQEFLLRLLQRLVAILVTGVCELNYFDSNQFAVYHRVKISKNAHVFSKMQCKNTYFMAKLSIL